MNTPGGWRNFICMQTRSRNRITHMCAEEIEALLEQRPLIPFRLRLSDGSSYDITRADMVFVTPPFLVVGIPLRQESRIAEQIHHVSLSDVVRAEVIPDGQTTPAP